MRQLLLIAAVVATFLYGAVASQRGVPAVAAPYVAGAKAPAQGLEALDKALRATGARLDEVTLTGWGEVHGSADRDRLQAALGWKDKAPAGETRTVTLRDRDGHTYAIVCWVINGAAAARWQQDVTVLQKALQQVAAGSSVSVQVSGLTQADGLTELTGQALGALSATDRQPWSDARAASVAGRTTHLPPGPFGVNVQVAVRRDAAKGQTRVWVAWPALLQEY